jgi:hypothetical protein
MAQVAHAPDLQGPKVEIHNSIVDVSRTSINHALLLILMMDKTLMKVSRLV